jgi:hypothetical protein
MIKIKKANEEEIKMGRELGEEYVVYRVIVPFMFPLPRLVSDVITAPIRYSLKKDRPENRKELIVTFMVYLGLLVMLSLPFLLLDVPGYIGWTRWPLMY